MIHSRFPAAGGVCLITLGFAAAAATASEVQLGAHRFALPDGFEIALAADPPLVERPIMADFDNDGHLYVAESSGSNAPVEQQLEERPHRILRLTDTNGDGVFDARTVFADRMMFPEGILWHDGAVYVGAPPAIWKLVDTDGDGIADERSEWFDGKTLTGCANDIHGPYLGPDGLIYWCKGAFAEQTYERPDDAPFVTRASHIFRRRPEGGIIEPVMTGGMDNPVEVAFSREGERFFTTTFFQHPGGGKRDGLIHAVYGGVYGKDHDVLDGHIRTGAEVMPVLTHLGPAAPSGLTRCRSITFGPSFHENLFATLFNLRKVTRHVLVHDRAGFRSEDSDFLVSDNLDFHPTDVLEDADGSLLVIDTGGWYKLCCPTSQLAKPDVPGAIYRITRSGAQRPEDPRGAAIDWTAASPEDLAVLLGDPRPAVRDRAARVMTERGADAVPAAARAAIDASDPAVRRRACWTLIRIGGREALNAVTQALDDASASVAHAAAHGVGLHRWKPAAGALVGILKNGDRSAPLRRAACEALGRIGNPDAIPALLDTAADAAESDDRILHHSAVYALIEIGAPDPLLATARDAAEPYRTAAALIAIDQIGHGALAASDVVARVSHQHEALRSAALWIAGRHPKWGAEIAEAFRIAPPDSAQQLAPAVTAAAANSAVQQAVAARAGSSSEPAEIRTAALRIMAKAKIEDPPALWLATLTDILAENLPASAARAAFDAAAACLRGVEGDLPLSDIVLGRGLDASLAADLRLAALGALPEADLADASETFDFLLREISAENPSFDRRSTAIGILASARLDDSQLRRLADALASIAPMDVRRLLNAFEGIGDPEVGRAVIAALRAAPSAAAMVDAETLQSAFRRFPDSLRAEAEGAVADASPASVPAADRAARFAALETALPQGDIRRGQAVFNSAKAACITCHAMGYVGGELGPDLTRIGEIRSERDLLEAVVFPSASLVRSYETVAITCRDGSVHAGIVRGESADAITLATAVESESRIARDEVASVAPAPVSLMPAAYDQLLTPAELADLIAFLKAAR